MKTGRSRSTRSPRSWLVAPPADTPPDPAGYPWLAGTPPRDVLLYRNGDAVRGALGGFTGDRREVHPRRRSGTRSHRSNDLAAVGFNPRFARARKPKGPYARLVLTDGTRLDVTEAAVNENALLVKARLRPGGRVAARRSSSPSTCCKAPRRTSRT